MYKILALVAAGIVGLVLMFGGMLVSARNNAIGYENTVQEQESGMNVQAQRRHDLILSLVNTVEASGRFESSTLKDVIEMRKNAASGNVDQAQLNIQAIVEAYPVIQSTAGYTQLMTELAVTENLIAAQRKTYNTTVRSYKVYTKSFPTNLFLMITGYSVQDYTYLEINTPAYDTNLFKN